MMERAPYDVRIKVAWQNHRVDDVIRDCQWDLAQWLLAMGYGERLEAESPGRPAKLARAAAAKIADGSKKLFG